MPALREAKRLINCQVACTQHRLFLDVCLETCIADHLDGMAADGCPACSCSRPVNTARTHSLCLQKLAMLHARLHAAAPYYSLAISGSWLTACRRALASSVRMLASPGSGACSCGHTWQAVSRLADLFWPVCMSGQPADSTSSPKRFIVACKATTVRWLPALVRFCCWRRAPQVHPGRRCRAHCLACMLALACQPSPPERLGTLIITL